MRAQDHDLWLRSFLKNDLKVGYIRECLYFYRDTLNITQDKMEKAYLTAISLLTKKSKKSNLSACKIFKLMLVIRTKLWLLKLVPFFLLSKVLRKRRQSNDPQEMARAENSLKQVLKKKK